MKLQRSGRVVALLAASTLALAACSDSPDEATPAPDEPSTGASSEPAPAGEALEGTINGAGASSQESAMEGWIAGFQTEQGDGVTVNYDPVGSGAGRDAFIAGGETAFAGSDAALDEEELAAATERCGGTGIVEVPLYISPIAVTFNLEGITELNMDAATIAGIFTGAITTWNDPAIAATNEGVELPDTEITAVHREDDSGTTENFTEYLFAAAPDVWTSEPDGVWPLEGGEAGNGTSGVISAIEGADGTIGYADASRTADLGNVAVQVGEEFVPFTPEAAAAIVDASPAAEGRPDGSLALELARDSTEAGTYPIVLVSYSVGCQTYEDENEGALVKAFFTYLASEEGQAAAAESAGSAPISEDLRTQVMSAIELIGA